MPAIGYDKERNSIYFEHGKNPNVSRVYFKKYSGTAKGRKALLSLKDLENILGFILKDLTDTSDEEGIGKKHIKYINNFLFGLQEKYDYDLGVKEKES